MIYRKGHKELNLSSFVLFVNFVVKKKGEFL